MCAVQGWTRCGEAGRIARGTGTGAASGRLLRVGLGPKSCVRAYRRDGTYGSGWLASDRCAEARGLLGGIGNVLDKCYVQRLEASRCSASLPGRAGRRWDACHWHVCRRCLVRALEGDGGVCQGSHGGGKEARASRSDGETAALREGRSGNGGDLRIGLPLHRWLSL